MSEFKLKINPKVKVSFKNGEFFIDGDQSKAMIKRFCSKYDGKEGQLILRPFEKTKSNEQNKYYRGVLVQVLSIEWGLSNEECHQYLSNTHLVYSKNGFKLVKSTKLDEWSTEQWENYMSFLRSWASSEHSIYIPEPNEVDLSQILTVYW